MQVHVTTCTSDSLLGYMTGENLVVRGNFSPVPKPSSNNMFNGSNALSYAYHQLGLIYI